MAVSGAAGASTSIQVNGLASGIDTDAVIEQLLNIERIPLTRVDEREAEANTELTAWRSLNTRILALETSLTNLSSDSLFAGRKAATSNESAVVATAGEGNDLGNYQVTVLSLATKHQQISEGGYDSTTANVGEGSVTIQVGTAVFDPIEIGPDNSSLSGVRDAINNANLGVTASILDTGEDAGADRYRLVLNSSKTGTAAAIDVTFDLDGDIPTMVDLSAPQDAEIQVGTGANAVTVNSSNNTIDDFLPGVTLDLLKADPDEVIDVTIAADRSGVESQLRNFITNYNQLAGFFNDQFDYDEASKSTGVLFGDSSLLALQNDIVLATTNNRHNEGQLHALADIGISLNDFGELAITDRDAFDDAINSPEDLLKLLNDPDNGVITKLQDVMDQATTTTTGLISAKENVIQQTLEDIKDKRLNILRYVDKQELLLRQQFANMESTLSMLQSQSNQLAAQLGGILTQG